MVGQAELHLVPPVHEDIGVVAVELGYVGDPVDERDRRGEVVEAQVAHDRVALEPPLEPEQPGGDLIPGEKRRCHIVCLLCGSLAWCPRRPRCCSRSGWARTLSPSRMSVTTRRRWRSFPGSRETCCRPA